MLIIDDDIRAEFNADVNLKNEIFVPTIIRCHFFPHIDSVSYVSMGGAYRLSIEANFDKGAHMLKVDLHAKNKVYSAIFPSSSFERVAAKDRESHTPWFSMNGPVILPPYVTGVPEEYTKAVQHARLVTFGNALDNNEQPKIIRFTYAFDTLDRSGEPIVSMNMYGNADKYDDDMISSIISFDEVKIGNILFYENGANEYNVKPLDDGLSYIMSGLASEHAFYGSKTHKFVLPMEYKKEAVVDIVKSVEKIYDRVSTITWTVSIDGRPTYDFDYKDTGLCDVRLHDSSGDMMPSTDLIEMSGPQYTMGKIQDTSAVSPRTFGFNHLGELELRIMDPNSMRFRFFRNRFQAPDTTKHSDERYNMEPLAELNSDYIEQEQLLAAPVWAHDTTLNIAFVIVDICGNVLVSDFMEARAQIDEHKPYSMTFTRTANTRIGISNSRVVELHVSRDKYEVKGVHKTRTKTEITFHGMRSTPTYYGYLFTFEYED